MKIWSTVTEEPKAQIKSNKNNTVIYIQVSVGHRFLHLSRQRETRKTDTRVTGGICH
jgi:hypothetical protein